MHRASLKTVTQSRQPSQSKPRPFTADQQCLCDVTGRLTITGSLLGVLPGGHGPVQPDPNQAQYTLGWSWAVFCVARARPMHNFLAPQLSMQGPNIFF